MTREEAKNRFKTLTNKLRNNSASADVLLIDKIYDDIESRVCENCKYVNVPCTVAQEAYHELGYNLDEFGCNKFERKVESR